MKNKNRIYRAAALLLVLCFISTVMISGTFAKYTSTYSGQDTALVARWSFTGFVGQDSGTIETTTGEQGATLGLFDHAYKTHINKQGTDNTYIIAPGVSGEFVVAMDYLADVDADVGIDISPLGTNPSDPSTGVGIVPIEYSVDGNNWVTLGGLAEALASKIINEPNITGNEPNITGIANPDNGEVTLPECFRIARVAAGSNDAVEILETVQWRWAYDETEQGSTHAIQSDNAVDTTLGETSATSANGRTSYGIEITLTATQVAPETT